MLLSLDELEKRVVACGEKLKPLLASDVVFYVEHENRLEL
jgi:hypothetical protein